VVIGPVVLVARLGGPLPFNLISTRRLAPKYCRDRLKLGNNGAGRQRAVASVASFIWRRDPEMAAGALPQVQNKAVLQEAFGLFLRGYAPINFGEIFLMFLLALELIGKRVLVFDVLQIRQFADQIPTSLRALKMHLVPYPRRHRLACNALKLAAKPDFINASGKVARTAAHCNSVNCSIAQSCLEDAHDQIGGQSPPDDAFIAPP
jgi:hypothetical protein